jgi:hypothetical protein
MRNLDMTTAISVARQIARTLPAHVLHSEFSDSDHFANDLVSHFLFEDNLPDDLVSLLKKRLFRRLDTVRRNLQRRHNRARRFREEYQSPSRLLDASEDLGMRDLLEKAACSQFDKEAIAAETGNHLEYADFAEFAALNAQCSRGEAYKRRRALHARIRSLAEA